jgi:exodeoxyribonuclease VII small subunit
VSSKKPANPELELEAAVAVTIETAPTADFERSLSELEAIVEQLEQGELSLDDSLKQFERGVQLTRVCQSALKQAEQKVEILLRKTGHGDDFETAPFRAEADE